MRSDQPQHHDDIIYPETIPFLLVHLACLGAIWTGVTTRDLVLCLMLYAVRMFAVTAGYHRYFSHRSFQTGRVAQFVLAFLCQSSAQKGVLWWAAKHREHHTHSDTPQDVHSPKQRGFLFAHLGWIFSASKSEPDYGRVKDLARYPELVWLNRHQYLPPTLLALAVLALGGWSGLIVGFFWSTVLLYHGTFAINSLAHVIGGQRYVTGDDSRNNWWLALITLGEGWHNNHHYYQASTRQGFRWWEIDLTFYVLKLLSWTRLVWGLRTPPPAVVRGDRRLPTPVVERVARQLAASFSIERICARVRETWGQTVDPELLRRRADQALTQLEAYLAEVQLPELPTLDELKARGREMFAHTPSLEEIVKRARQILVREIWAELCERPRLLPA